MYLYFTDLPPSRHITDFPLPYRLLLLLYRMYLRTANG